MKSRMHVFAQLYTVYLSTVLSKTSTYYNLWNMLTCISSMLGILTKINDWNTLFVFHFESMCTRICEKNHKHNILNTNAKGIKHISTTKVNWSIINNCNVKRADKCCPFFVILRILISMWHVMQPSYIIQKGGGWKRKVHCLKLPVQSYPWFGQLIESM